MADDGAPASSSGRAVPLYKQLTSRRAVLAAFADYDHRGEEAFHARYGFRAADTYVVRHKGRSYPSKAIVGVAYGFQFPDRGPLGWDQFSGGKGAAAGHLSRLGFDVDGVARQDQDWTLAEVEAIVERYFLMLADQAAGSYDRAAHLAAAAAAVPRKAEGGAIGRKLSNISAVLKAMDLPILAGFGALDNTQTLLSAIVHDRMSADPSVMDVIAAAPPAKGALATQASVEVDAPDAGDLAATERNRKACKVDFAGRDERNRALGRAGEAWALDFLKAELVAAGKADLAERVSWVSDVLGDGLGFDIAAFDLEGEAIRVEVKTTNGGRSAPFCISANEVAASADAGPDYVLFRIFNFRDGPGFYRVRGLVEDTFHLRPTTFLARPAKAT